MCISIWECAHKKAVCHSDGGSHSLVSLTLIASNHSTCVCHPNQWAPQRRKMFPSSLTGPQQALDKCFLGGWINQQPVERILSQSVSERRHSSNVLLQQGLWWWVGWLMRGFLCLGLPQWSGGTEEVSLWAMWGERWSAVSFRDCRISSSGRF